jgi:GntR family transcriptional regulator / MocR family aminotransferase
MQIADYLSTLRLAPGAQAPLFQQLYDAIKGGILESRIKPGTQLPPTRGLARLLGVSRQTVIVAYAQLTAEGFLAGTVGKGTFINDKLPIAASRKPAKPGAELHLLSARGARFVDPRASMVTHEGAPRAFRVGMPGLDAFPFPVWARLESRCWRQASEGLGYADPAGLLRLRELLAAYLSTSRGVHCAAEQVVVTSGSQQALFLIATLLLAPGDAAWVEDPGYRGASGALYAAGARVCPVPVDAEGLSVALGSKHHPDARLVYSTPAHQYPLGMSMSLPRRLELLAWAARHKAWVVEDDYDSEYRYDGPPLASLQSLDKAGCVIYVGTLSKILFPGLRLGYLVLPPALVEAFARGKAVIDRHTSTVEQRVLADFMAEGHFNRHIKRTREVYAERHEALLQALDSQLADEIDLAAANSGLHVALAFRRDLDDVALEAAAARRGIEVRALSRLYAPQESTVLRAGTPSGLLLGFASVPPQDTRAGVKTLRSVLKEFRRGR